VIAATVGLALPAVAHATHPRPRSATPLTAALVPAYQPCTAPDRTHGPSLEFPSCSGPRQTSEYLTVGNPPAQFVGSVQFKAYPGVPGPPDDNYLYVTVDMKDVRCRAASGACTGAGADYAGSVRLEAAIRGSDHWNAVDPGGGLDPATMQDYTLAMNVPCTQTSDPGIGSSCYQSLFLEAFIPGSYVIKDGKRTIWEVGQPRVYDGGADGDGSTAGDDTLFAVQGLFVP
jgi:hypothetical protein